MIPYVLEVGGQEVVLTPDPAHEFTATTEQVALGYGVTPENIRKHKETKSDELVEGKHFLSVSITHAGNGNLTQTLWTKRGIVRLGFFIRSARARLFRDMAEDLVLSAMSAPATPALVSARGLAEAFGVAKKVVFNRLSHAGIKPTHHYFEPVCGAPAYLYPLDAVQARWPAVVFEPERCEAFPGVAPVAQAVSASRSGKSARAHHPRLIPTDNALEQLAKRLLSLEAQKKAVLKELASLGGGA